MELVASKWRDEVILVIHNRSSVRRRFRREVADIEHGPQQFGLGQDGLRFRHHVRGRVLAAGNVIVEQCLDFGHALVGAREVTGHSPRAAVYDTEICGRSFSDP